ncbi:hypothetical protein SCLCIDRAFT_653532 [Scleroderma citrinum Foug A]|uniref:Uncharacterized protein n=1 Tax=Scleroderma citrinum Foug A TaxID=1036808 RepID=A0A0C3D4I3_9AGAM|nr:hypothetical protein SCLCIDRAFT_653532 [Scleroderma citrinum Foug A]
MPRALRKITLLGHGLSHPKIRENDPYTTGSCHTSKVISVRQSTSSRLGFSVSTVLLSQRCHTKVISVRQLTSQTLFVEEDSRSSRRRDSTATRVTSVFSNPPYDMIGFEDCIVHYRIKTRFGELPLGDGPKPRTPFPLISPYTR